MKKHKLCYNCTKSSHLAAKCGSRSCGRCGFRHYTSLCDKLATTTSSSGGTDETKGSRDKYFGALEEQTTLHATVLVEVNGVKARIMLDTGVWRSYISISVQI